MDKGKKAETSTRSGGSLTFTVRCSLEELREIERAAIAAGLPRSRFVVLMALGSPAREPKQGRTQEAPVAQGQNPGSTGSSSPRKWSSNIEDLAMDPTWSPDFQEQGEEPGEVPPGEIYRSPQVAGGEVPPERAREPKGVLQPATPPTQGKRSLLRGPAEDAALRAADLKPKSHPGGLQGELLEAPPPEPDQEDPEAVKAQENIFTTWGRKDPP